MTARIPRSRDPHTRCVYHTYRSLRVVRTRARPSIEPAIWRRYARACGFTGRVQRLAPSYTCLPPAIIASLQGPIIEKPRLLLYSHRARCCETIFLLGAHEPRAMVRRITGHYRDVSSPGSVIHRGPVMGKDEQYSICGRHLEALSCTTRVKWRTIINDSLAARFYLSPADFFIAETMGVYLRRDRKSLAARTRDSTRLYEF